MNTIKEKENMIQTVFLVMIVMFKRYFGYVLGEYENVLFVFIAVAGFYLIHFLFVKFAKDYPEKDHWEEKLNLGTLVLYGIGLLVLHLLNVNNVYVMAAVGIILITINVLIKTKRRAILKRK